MDRRYLYRPAKHVMERGQQVSLMSDIYSHAERVVAWLGPASEGSSSAIKTDT